MTLTTAEHARLMARISTQAEAARSTLATYRVDSLDDLRREFDVRIECRALELLHERLRNHQSGCELVAAGTPIDRKSDRETYAFSVQAGDQGQTGALAILSVDHSSDPTLANLAARRAEIRVACQEEACARFNNLPLDERVRFVGELHAIRKRIADAQAAGDMAAAGRLSFEVSKRVADLGYGVELDEVHCVARSRHLAR